MQHFFRPKTPVGGFLLGRLPEHLILKLSQMSQLGIRSRMMYPQLECGCTIRPQHITPTPHYVAVQASPVLKFFLSFTYSEYARILVVITVHQSLL